MPAQVFGPMDQSALRELTVEMLEEGTASCTAAQIALEVESVGASVAASSGWDAAYVSFKCLTDNLPRILDLAADILLYPTFPDAEWARVRGQTLAALLEGRNMHARRLVFRSILESVPDQVLKELFEVDTFDRNRR